MSVRWTFPLTLDAGRLATHEQDTLADVTQCVHVLTRTRRGSRPLAPNVGFDDPTFSDVEADEIVGPLAGLEPRADVTVTVAIAPDGRSATRSIRVALKDNPNLPEAR